VFQNRVLRRIFGPNSHEIVGSFFKNCIMRSFIRMMKSRRMKWAGHVARMGTKRNAYRVSVGKPEGKIPLRRPRHRLVDNIKMNLRDIGWGGIEWIDLAQDMDQWRALVNTVMNLFE
jgi:hypothetical protein